MNIKIQGIDITLTEEQLDKIQKKLNNKNKYQNYTDIKSVQDAISFLKDKDLISKMTNIVDLTIEEKIQIVAKAVNQFHKKDNKYYFPYFNIENGSVGFLGSDCYYCYFSRCVVAVAVYSSQEISDYVGKTFIDLYNELYKKTLDLL